MKDTRVGTLVAIYAVMDLPIGLALALFAAWGRPWLVFLIAFVILAIVNVAACSWIQRRWDLWMTDTRRTKLEARLQRMRGGRLRPMVEGLADGSIGWYLVAASFANAIRATTTARVLSGQPVPQRKVLVTALFFAIAFPAVCCVAGWLVGDVIRG